MVASGRSEALFKGQALAHRGGWRRIERNSELAVESGTASVGRRISSHHCCIPYPPGPSKWNLIDHRMFSLISENWTGEPLESYAVMLKWIQKTRSETGFTCRACLHRGCYTTGGKITEQEKATIHLKPRKVLPKWNYTIWPHKPPRNTGLTKTTIEENTAEKYSQTLKLFSANR